MTQKLIIHFVLSLYIVLEIGWAQSLESVINTSTQNSLPSVYSHSNSAEEAVLSDSYNNQNQEDILYSSPHEDIDYETHEPREHYKRIPYAYDYRNGINSHNSHYNKHPFVQRNPYMRTRYQPYMPSHNVHTYYPKHSSNSIVENNHKQQPVYANLYWRKIIYPFPSYSGQNNKENVFLANSLENPQTEESKIINRRYMSGNPYKSYYRYRNRYPFHKIGNAKHMKAFYRPNGYIVRKGNRLMQFKPNSMQFKPNSMHFPNAAHYKRRPKYRPINSFSNRYDSHHSKSLND